MAIFWLVEKKQDGGLENFESQSVFFSHSPDCKQLNMSIIEEPGQLTTAVTPDIPELKPNLVGLEFSGQLADLFFHGWPISMCQHFYFEVIYLVRIRHWHLNFYRDIIASIDHLSIKPASIIRFKVFLGDSGLIHVRIHAFDLVELISSKFELQALNELDFKVIVGCLVVQNSECKLFLKRLEEDILSLAILDKTNDLVEPLYDEILILTHEVASPLHGAVDIHGEVRGAQRL